MSDFISLYTAFSGLQAAQAGMDVTSHNIANAATKGYTRQRVDLVTRPPYLTPFGPMGNGVDIDGIHRARHEFLDARVRSGASNLGRLTTLGDLLGNVESVMGEPDSGITAGLGDMWNAFEDLALDPPNTAARLNVIGKLDALTSNIRSVAEQWSAAADAAAQDLAVRVDEVNGLLDEVADLNRSILNAAGEPGPPNDLLDRRDVLLDRLAELAGTTSSIASDGSARVSLGGLALVSGVTVSKVGFDASTNTVTHASGAVAKPGGEIAGYQAFLVDELPALQASLDGFVEDLTAALNGRHAAGFTPGGVSGGPLLTYTAGAAALTVDVSVTDPNDLAASGTTGVPFPEFDGDNAQALADLRSSLAAGGGTQTLDDAIRAVVGEVAGKTSSAFAAADAQERLVASAETARMQANGVSIDEEMVNLITYQRSYEAAARVMTAIDQTLDTLINRTGVVGR